MVIKMEDLELNFTKLKRFSREKHDQIASLINYATLMGLSGKDLVSIGGKMERDSSSKERKERIAICDSMVMPLRGSKVAYPDFKIMLNGRLLTARRQYSSQCINALKELVGYIISLYS